MRLRMVLAVAIAVLAGMPMISHAAPNDLCVTYVDSCCEERVIGKDFGALPAKNKCKALTGFMLPFFSVSNGTVCTSADGATLYVEWTSMSNSSPGAAIWSAQIPLPLPNNGTGQVVGINAGSTPGGQSLGAMSAAKCEAPVPNSP